MNLQNNLRIWIIIFIMFCFLPLGYAGEYIIDPAQSEAVFEVEHAVGFNSGFIKGTAGTISLDRSDTGIKAVDLSFDMNTVDSLNSARDDFLKGPEFFNVKEFPTVTFKSKKVKEEKITGNLTFRDVSRPIEFSYQYWGKKTDEASKDVIAVTLQAEVDRRDFGMTYNKLAEDGTRLLGDKIKITMVLKAIAP